ncbi:hypothetical protein RclHR1_08680004 [Rhizophagus clarus]|uniref:Uncharacterized protein n=1 Tax=Rhizophagus clarus TaxID=94130 RepID=A0A2Z6SNQ6_9GLOM|nr:hypothetical protein RclHR1_08680004 [Rhizophagus clarus]
MIYLDSETVYNNYYNLINTTNIISIRDLFKTQHNPSLWIIIKDLLRHYKHNLTLVKIKAHTINSRHNEVDAYIKNSHNNINDIFPTNLSFSHLDTSNFIPTWNNYIIETNLRRFIRLTTRIYSLEKFFNLNRNSKYHMLDLQWDITFEYINSQTEDETYFTTNHFLHKVKWQKIQRLIEELPTIEHLKKSLYDVYRNILCVHCKKKKETFQYVWTCKYNKKFMKTIIKEAINLISESQNITWKVTRIHLQHF